MNTHLWYLMASKSVNARLSYVNWKDFRFQMITIDELPISVDFGDGNIQSVPGNNSAFLYSKSSASNGDVTIFNANRVRQLSLFQSAPYNVNWNFSLVQLRVMVNLLSFSFNSGNIFGDAGNLSPILRTFALIAPSFGEVKNLSPLPSTLNSFNQTSTNADYYFVGSQIADEMPLLTNLTISGKSKVEMSLSQFPQHLTNIEISNTNPFTVINRRSQITYAPFTVGVPLAGVSNGQMLRFVIDCENGFGFNSAELDSILIYLDSLTWNVPLQKVIRLSLGHGNRTSASNTAVANLAARPNMSISLNPPI